MLRDYHGGGAASCCEDRGSKTLTQAGHGEYSRGCGRGNTVGKDRLKHIVGEGHGDDSQAGGVHDEDSTPEQEESVSSEGQHGRGHPQSSYPHLPGPDGRVWDRGGPAPPPRAGGLPEAGEVGIGTIGN